MNFFDRGSPYLNHPLLTPTRTSSEVDDLMQILGLEPDHRVLDAGCGFGRHSIELAGRGVRTVGVDPSATMIEAAKGALSRELANVADRVTFHQCRVQDLHASDLFDGGICLFTSLGQIDDSGEDNRLMLQTISSAVRTGGVLVVEVPNRLWVRQNLQQQDTFGAGPNRTDVMRDYDEEANRVVEQFDVYTNGELQRFDLSYTLFDHDELTSLLCETGFDQVELYPSLEAAVTQTGLTAPEESIPTLVAVATVR